MDGSAHADPITQVAVPEPLHGQPRPLGRHELPEAFVRVSTLALAPITPHQV